MNRLDILNNDYRLFFAKKMLLALLVLTPLMSFLGYVLNNIGVIERDSLSKFEVIEGVNTNGDKVLKISGVLADSDLRPSGFDIKRRSVGDGSEVNLEIKVGLGVNKTAKQLLSSNNYPQMPNQINYELKLSPEDSFVTFGHEKALIYVAPSITTELGK